MDILKRMKLIALPPPMQSMGIASPIGSPTTTNGMRPPSNETSSDDVRQSLSSMMGTLSGPDEGLAGRRATTVVSDLDRSDSRHSVLSEPISEPPRPPSADPWQLDKILPMDPDEQLEEEQVKRRPLVDSPTLHPSALYSVVNPPNQGLEDHRRSTHRDDDDRRMRAASRSFGPGSEGSFSPPPQSARWTSSTYGSNESSSAPAPLQASRQQKNASDLGQSSSNSNDATGHAYNHVSSRSPSDASLFSCPSPLTQNATVEKGHGRGNSLNSEHNFPTRQASLAAHNQLSCPKRQPSAESVNSSVFDIIEFATNRSPVENVKRSSMMSAAPSSQYSPIVLQPPAYPSHPLPHKQPGRLDSISGTIGNRSMITLPGNTSPESLRFSPSILDGLIPVETEGSIRNMPLPPRQPDCSIGPNSSFYKLKGFCKGAEEARRGGLGFKKIKRPVGVSNVTTHPAILNDELTVYIGLFYGCCGQVFSLPFRARV